MENDLIKPILDPIIPNSISPVFYTTYVYGKRVDFRYSGDKYVLIWMEMNEFELDQRFYIHLLYEELSSLNLSYIKEIAPGVTSLLIKYDTTMTSPKEIALLVVDIFMQNPLDQVQVQSVLCRDVKLPLYFRDELSLEAISKYSKTICKGAPYLPDNCEFIREINNLSSLEEVSALVERTTYLVMGLGDVYLGAPCAVPVDPRHRIVTTKYNPARTYTPEGAVGIGGIFMCIYGMDSPGGYQLIGRTIPIWDNNKLRPWLLSFFDKVSFYLVGKDEFHKIRKNYKLGLWNPEIVPSTINLKDYKKFLEENLESINLYKEQNNIKTINQRIDWSKMQVIDSGVSQTMEGVDLTGCEIVKSKVYGNLYEIMVKEGDEDYENQNIMLIEVMKMSIYVTATSSGKVHKIISSVGTIVKPKESLIAIKKD